MCVYVQGLWNQTASIYVLTLLFISFMTLAKFPKCSASGILIWKMRIMISSFMGLFVRIT